jgi:hypothetical protein
MKDSAAAQLAYDGSGQAEFVAGMADPENRSIQ